MFDILFKEIKYGQFWNILWWGYQIRYEYLFHSYTWSLFNLVLGG